MSVDLLAAAQDYARRGWKVFPCCPIRDGVPGCGNPKCSSPGKHPLTASGFKNASSEPAQIGEWWLRWPDANIGIATGAESGAFVLDLDGPEAVAEVELLEGQYGKLPLTVQARTGKGFHYYFRTDPEHPLGNRTKVNGLPIDVRGDGGYVIGPPSAHKSGSRYEWVHAPGQTEVAPAPGWLFDYLSGGRKPTANPVTADPFLECVEFDLRTHSGVGEGARHDTATRLIGAELARGTGQLEVLALANEWADRCRPPMDRDEVFGIVRDLAAKDACKLEEAIDTAPQSVIWPTLEEEAYYGLAGEIVRTIEPHTEADPAAVLVQLLAMFGNEVGRNPFAAVGPTRHYANLYAVIAGESAKARKGTSGDVVKALFGDAITKRILSGLSSGEGVVARVTDAVFRKEPIRDREKKVTGYQDVLDTPAVEDKRLLVLESEFGSVLQVMQRQGNNLSTVLRCAWESGNLSVNTKVLRQATGAHITLLGHVTVPELKKLLQGTDCFNGFSNRFLWTGARRSKRLPDGGGTFDLSAFGERLGSAVRTASGFRLVSRDEPAGVLWRELYTGELDREYPGLLGAVTGRGEAYVLRLSLIYALFDGSAVIRAEHVRVAMAVWRYCMASARLIFGDSTGNELADRLLLEIRERPRTTTELHAILNRHASKTKISAALNLLVRSGLVRAEVVKTGGRDGKRWLAA